MHEVLLKERWLFDDIAGEKKVCICYIIYIPTFFSPAILSNFHHYFNNSFHEFKVLKIVIVTETFNIDFHSK